MDMTPEQFRELLKMLERIATNQYTITGAADWPILLICISGFGGLIIALIGMMWADLRGGQREHKTDNDKDIDAMWNALRDCQHDCCPPRVKK